jgi:hypothetical protein
MTFCKLFSLYSVTIKIPNWGHKKPYKKDKKYLLIPSLNIVPASFRTKFTLLIQLNTWENASSRITFSPLVTVCWIDKTALNLDPFIAIFNLGSKKSEPALNQGNKVDQITWGPLILPKTQRQRLKNALMHCRAEDIRTHFPETQA